MKKKITHKHDTNGREDLMSKIKNVKKKNYMYLSICSIIRYIVFDVYKNEYREENKEKKKKLCANEKYKYIYIFIYVYIYISTL